MSALPATALFGAEGVRPPLRSSIPGLFRGCRVSMVSYSTLTGGGGRSGESRAALRHALILPISGHSSNTEFVQATLPAGATFSSSVTAMMSCCTDHTRVAFSQTQDGVCRPPSRRYAEAIARLETLRERGAEFLLFPSTGVWWLDHYGEFKEHLESHYAVVARQEEICMIFALAGRDRIQRATTIL